jgi:hypothetical protein
VKFILRFRDARKIKKHSKEAASAACAIKALIGFHGQKRIQKNSDLILVQI